MIKQVVICIVKIKGKVLFVKRSEEPEFMPGAWSLPSGQVKDSETPMETLKRKLLAELGVVVGEVDLLDTIVEDEEGHGKIEKQIYTVIPSNVEEIKFNLFEADGVVLSTFEYFYDHFGKDEMGHILVHLKDTYQGLGFH